MARCRADALRAKLKKHASGALPLDSPDAITNRALAAATVDVDRRVKQYLDAAVRFWLPQAYPEGSHPGDPRSRHALFFLADLTAQKHNDRWLSDLLQGSSASSFPGAAAALARASLANEAGDYEIAAGTARVHSCRNSSKINPRRDEREGHRRPPTPQSATIAA